MLPRALILSVLLAAACTPARPAQTPAEVAHEYVRAWCRGDGSHAALEFAAEELPELYRRHSRTSRLPEGVALQSFELVSLGVSGPGMVPELSEWGFDVTAGPQRAERVISIAVICTVRLADGAVLRNQVIELRPPGSFRPGERAQVSSADDYAGAWKVLPPAG